MFRTWRNLMGKFFLNWRGCFLTRYAKSNKFSGNKIFWVVEKFPKKYGEPCSQQVNLPQFSFNYRQSKANLVKYLQFTPIFLKNSVFLSQIYPFFAQIYEKFSGFDGFKKIKLAMHTICHLFSTLWERKQTYQLTNQLTYLLTWVGARDTCVSLECMKM